MDRSQHYATGAAALLISAALVEAARIIFVMPWQGFTVAASNVVSGLLIVIWTGAAVALLLRRKGASSATLAWLLAFAAPVAMLAHGAVTRVGGSIAGLLYIPAAFALAFLLKRTLDHGEWQSLPPAHSQTPPGGRA